MSEFSEESDLTEGWDRCLEINPFEVNVLNGKGECLLYVYRLSEAMECFEIALSIDPNSSRSLTNKGNVLLEMGKFNEAIDNFNKSLLLDPKDVFAIFYKGKSCYFLKNYEEAINCYDEALILRPIEEISNIWYEKGLAFFELEGYENSVESFDKALDFEFNSNPNSIEKICTFLSAKSRSLLFLKKADSALECSEMILELQPENPNALKIREICFKRLSKNPIL